MAKLAIQWQLIAASDDIRRSSQTIAVADGTVEIFGGELKPREPVDNKIYCVDLKSQSSTLVTTKDVTTEPPTPRVGAASTTLQGTTYIFSGRGGTAMTPIDEQGSLWAFKSNTWSLIEPANPSAPSPPPRSYHAMTNDGRDAIYVHAGCPTSGRLNDLWVFVLSTKRWVQLATAPGSPRGGTSIAHCGAEDSLFRINGFDGKNQVGGSVDVYNPVNDCWTSRQYAADGTAGPVARSVGCAVCVQVGGKSWLVTAFGEREPSSLGHAGAGKFLNDVWAYDVKEGVWTEVEIVSRDRPRERGWFAAEAFGSDRFVVHGGLAEDNSRLGDVWVGKIGLK